MIIEEVDINNFRNIVSCKIKPAKNINFICGLNAQGKTNLIEAIYFSSLFKSFRTNIKNDLVNKDSDIFNIKLNIENNKVNNKIDISFGKNKKNIILVNNKNNLSKERILNTIIYFPDEISNLKSYPSYRRNIIDRSIFFIDNNYLSIFKKYLKCLKQRNVYLKNSNKNDIWRDQLIEYGSLIVLNRINYVKRINIKFEELKNNYLIDENYNIEYKNYNKKNIKDKLLEKFIKNKDKEVQYGYTLVGPHIDDITFKINGYNINKYSSEGQKRSLLLTYKRAQLSDYKENKGYYPILLLDDIGNEIDSTRKNKIFETIIENSGQVFVTTTNCPEKLNGKIYRVTNGTFEEIY